MYTSVRNVNFYSRYSFVNNESIEIHPAPSQKHDVKREKGYS